MSAAVSIQSGRAMEAVQGECGACDAPTMLYRFVGEDDHAARCLGCCDANVVEARASMPEALADNMALAAFARNGGAK